MKNTPSQIGLAYIVAASIFWGASFPATKIGLAYVDPARFALMRFLVASAAIVLVGLVARRLNLAILRVRGIWLLGGLNAVGFVAQNLGIFYTTASKSALLLNTSAVMVAGISMVFLNERPTAKKWLGVLLGTVGAVLVSTKGSLAELGGGEAVGDALNLFSALIVSIFIIQNKHLLSNGLKDSFAITSALVLTTTTLLLPLAFYPSSVQPLAITTEGWVVIGFTGVACTILPFFFWNQGLKLISATSSSIILLLEIVVALTLSITILGETLNTASSLGVTLILAAITLVSR